MEDHHRESIRLFLRRYQSDPNLLAVLMGGSLAHGYARPDSDIDLLLLVEEGEFARRKSEKKLTFSVLDICTYPGGYIDCKVIDLPFINQVIRNGSDPARYAFQDAEILFSRLDTLPALLAGATAFPVAKKASRRERFAAQVLAWKWYYVEGRKRNNAYLLSLAVQKLVLFSCRLILNENEMLYTFHKWLLRETQKAPHKPLGFDNSLQQLLTEHDQALVNGFCEAMLTFLDLDEVALDWANHFIRDSEMNWLDGEPPVDDL